VTLADLLLRIRALVLPNRVERELDEELEAHLEIEVARGIERGLSAEEARRAARLAFGNAALIAEDCREQRGVRWLEDLGKDLTYGVRQLLKQKGFAAVAALTLALGVGASTAIFSAVEGVLLRPLPYSNPDRLVALWPSLPSKGLAQMPFTIPDLRELASRSRSFESVAGYYSEDVNLADGLPERVIAVAADANLFPMLGVGAALGRTFTAGENSFGNHYVVVIGDALWKRRFNARADVIGRSLQINGELCEIVGVMAPSFQFPSPAVDLWRPLSFAPNDNMATRNNSFTSAIARLKPHVSLGQARNDVRRVGRELDREFYYRAGVGMEASSYLDSVVGGVRQPLLLLLGAVGLVLVIACVNVANLLLARASGRRGELALRSALGASRGRLARQLLSESMLLAAMGACLGVALSLWLVRLIRVLGPQSIPRLAGIGVNLHVLAFTASVTLASVLLFGLTPAFGSARVRIGETLKDGGRSQSPNARATRFREVLVIAEIAFSMLLVAGAGQVFRTFERVRHIDPGFRAENVLTFSVPLPDGSDSRKAVRFYEDLTQRLELLPGVKAAGASSAMPIADLGVWGKFLTDEEHPPSGLAEAPPIQYRQVTPHYRRALGIPLLAGRFFTDSDAAEQPLVAAINETARRRLFPNSDPIGKRVFTGPPEYMIAKLLPPGYRFPRLTIVGVIGDIRHTGLAREPQPEIYVPHAQGVNRGMESSSRKMFFVLTTTSDPKRFVAAARAAVQSLSADQPIADVASMDQRLDTSLARERFHLFLFGAFAAVALLLAAVGVFGVMAYSVRLRAPEIGIRVALGASVADVLGLVVIHGLKIGLAGIVIGVALALAAMRLMTSLLFGTQGYEVVTFVGASLALVAAVAVACLVPTLRAARINPLTVLRAE